MAGGWGFFFGWVVVWEEGLDGMRYFVGFAGFVKRTMQSRNLYCRWLATPKKGKRGRKIMAIGIYEERVAVRRAWDREVFFWSLGTRRLVGWLVVVGFRSPRIPDAQSAGKLFGIKNDALGKDDKTAKCAVKESGDWLCAACKSLVSDFAKGGKGRLGTRGCWRRKSRR